MKKFKQELNVPSIASSSASVGTAEIEADAIDGTKIADDSIDSEHYAAGSIDTEHIAANQVTGAKVPERAIGEIEQVAVTLDHADVSPKELLAADANNDRVVWVRAVATEAAAGEPDVDVGSATTAINAIVDDFAAGAWAVGDRFEGICVLPKTEALVATIAAAGTAGTFSVYVTAITPLVQRAQIAADAIDGTKLADDAVDSEHYVDGSIDTAHIADDQVTTGKMAMTIPITLAIPATLANRGGSNSDGVLVGLLTPQAIDYAVADDGGAFTNETTAANNATDNDVTLLPATEDVNDAYYFGQAGKFCGIKLDMGTQGVSGGGGAAAITWEYYNGATWATLETSQFVDDSAGFTAGTDTYFITFTPPSDWAQVAVDPGGLNLTAYWVRARCAVADYTTVPLGKQVWILELNAGEGVRMPFAGTISAIQAHATTNSATNNDSVFLVINLTQGTFDTFVWTKGDPMDRDTTVSLAVAAGDEIAVMMVQEDGTTEYASASLILEVAL